MGMGTNVTAEDMTAVLQQIPGLEHDGVQVDRSCDQYAYCSWDVKFAGLINSKESFDALTISLNEKSTQHVLLSDVSHLTTTIETIHSNEKSAFGDRKNDPDTTKSAFTGIKEIDISDEEVPWLPKQKKTFVLKDIYMATVNPFTVQVALHNAGGYSEAVTIEPFPPAEPEGLDVIMDQD